MSSKSTQLTSKALGKAKKALLSFTGELASPILAPTRTRHLAEAAIFKFENAQRTKFANRLQTDQMAKGPRVKK
jgi:hypothetical protein